MTTSHDDDEADRGLEIRLLGPVRVVYRHQDMELGGMQARSVLAVLMLHPGQVVPRSVIVRNAWRGAAPSTAPTLVAAYVSRLRQALAPAAAHVSLDAVRPGFRARIDPELVDAHRFTALVRQAERDKSAREDELAITHFEQALDQWHGSTLALEDVEAQWLRAQAETLQELRLDALERLAALYCDTGQPARAVEALQGDAPRQLQRDGLVALQVRALAATGQGALAVQLADRAREALDEAGLPLGPRLREARRHAQRPSPAPNAEGVPRQLPPDTSALTGRERELAELLQLAETTRDAPAGALVISAIDGMAGIGKTALAVHAGHLLAEQFPHGQLFVDLHGFTQGLEPSAATDVLADVLRTLGVPPQQIPESLDARAALYRDRLAGRRMLVVLDNAVSEEQVRPLLPGQPGCLVLVTSRRRLKALDDARVLSLDVLAVPDALALLRTLAGPGRIPPGDPLLEQVAGLCGYLPLALRIAAALLRHRPAWTLAHLAGKLRDAHPALAGFRDGDRDLAAVFDLSYTALPTQHQSVFRRLGLHPGPDIDAYAAAALTQSTPTDTDDLLQDLVDRSLLLEYAPGRYRMHDLVRAYARTLRSATDPDDGSENALARLLNYYEHTADRATPTIARPPRSAPTGPPPTHGPDLSDPRNVGAWLRAERPNLEAAFDDAAARGWDAHVVQLAASLAAPILSDGPFTRAVIVHQAGAQAADRIGNRLGQAAALTELGRAQLLTGDYPAAAASVAQALDLYRDLGDTLGQAYALTDLGRARSLAGDHRSAAEAHAQAVDLHRKQGNALGLAYALTELGRARYLISDFPAAADTYSQALEIFRDEGNVPGQVHVAGELGHLKYLTGDYAGAAEAQTQALEFHRKTSNQLAEAYALTSLARARQATGDYAGATEILHQALDIFRERGHLIGQAQAFIELGRVMRLTADHQAAIKTLTQALQISRELGSRSGELLALNEYAATLAATGGAAQAVARYHEALAISREIARPGDEAHALEGIAEHHLAEGNTDQGAAHLRQALEIYQRLGMHPDATRATTRLTQVPGSDQGGTTSLNIS